jgi:uncharacterized protein YwgA
MNNTAQKSDIEKAISILRDAGGRIVGRTRLQKIACLFELANVGDGFYFVYHHYGPYCDELTWAVESAHVMGKIHEEEKRTNWGGTYSIFSLQEQVPPSVSLSIRQQLAQHAVNVNSIVLELAVTTAYFAKEGIVDPWQEVRVYKPDKANDERIEAAKKLYEELRSITDALPDI